VLGAGIEPGPERAGLRKRGELGAVANFGLFVPVEQGAEFMDLVEAAEHRLVGELVELFAAEIVLAPLHVADLETRLAGGGLAEKRMLKKWHVLEEELLLEIFGAGGDDHALAALDDGEEVRERLASAGAGFDDEVSLLLDGLLDGVGHGELSLAELVGRMALGEQPSGSKEAMEREAPERGRWNGGPRRACGWRAGVGDRGPRRACGWRAGVGDRGWRGVGH